MQYDHLTGDSLPFSPDNQRRIILSEFYVMRSGRIRLTESGVMKLCPMDPDRGKPGLFRDIQPQVGVDYPPRAHANSNSHHDRNSARCG